MSAPNFNTPGNFFKGLQSFLMFFCMEGFRFCILNVTFRFLIMGNFRKVGRCFFSKRELRPCSGTSYLVWVSFQIMFEVLDEKF